ncbi:Hypothetical protein PHPALM_3306 [Phytophthora palmivora]|uniref:Uncharacterized protein n=1 Tax=Phytophthora palmivora TaxID=4796 RepID=A0A2P4YMR0_9STRA|nr:Hypothetical protein PHPALM_3306 [Phytophthora palmivora]
MMVHLYSTAAIPADYQDAALLCLLWFLFGRASDLTLLRKAKLSIGSGDIFLVRFIRIKTSEEQGLSFFPDEDFATCPILAIAVALATQAAPGVALLSQIPAQAVSTQSGIAPATPLIDLLDNPEAMTSSQPAANIEKSEDAAPGVHIYVNRVLDRVMGKAGVTEHLTSHSFRRGGPQHANRAGLCAQWIFDSGAWNMTATNKAFTYVFNTPSEDHKVARILCGRDPDQAVPILSLAAFDSDTQSKIRAVVALLFHASYKLQATQYSVNGSVLDTLITYLLRQYPSLKQLNSDGVAIKRLEVCASKLDHSVNDLLAWSSHLACNTSASAQATTTSPTDSTSDITKNPMFVRQAALIEQLIQVNRKLDARMAMMEAKVYNKPQQTHTTTHKTSEDTCNEPASKRRRTSAATNLKDVWFAWDAQEPRMWKSTDSATKHERSTGKLVTAFLKLFLRDGFTIDEKSTQYRVNVLALGAAAEKELLVFLAIHNVRAGGAQNLLKALPSNSTTPSAKPKKNPICSHKEFRDLCHDTRQTYKMWISHEAIRHLRKPMNTTVASSSLLAEAIDVIFASLAQRDLRRGSLNDITEWLAPPAADDDAPSDEEEWHAEENLQGEKLHCVRKILDRKRTNRKTYYLTDWEPTWVPCENLNQTVIAKFNKEHRRLVRKTYIEYEAVEDNTLNKTKG